MVEIAQKYLLYISYIGFGFRGSQIQRNTQRCTVQGTLEKAINECFHYSEKKMVNVKLCSRTDAGVHATKAAVHTNLPAFKGAFIHPERITRRLNSWMTKHKHNLRVIETLKVPDIFDARKSALEKVYTYRIAIPKENFDGKPNAEPISELFGTYICRSPNNFDIQKLRLGAEKLIGEKNFGAFVSKLSKYDGSLICNIKSFKIEQTQAFAPEIDELAKYYDYYNFICTGNRFLYNMVRRMVGTLLAVGFHYITLEDFEQMIEKAENSDVRLHLYVAPPHGLYLTNIKYNPEHLILSEEEENQKLSVLQNSENAQEDKIETHKFKANGFKLFLKKIDEIERNLRG